MPPSKKTHRISRICFDSQPRRFHFTICHLIGWVNWISTGCQICKFWGRQTKMTRIRAGGSSRRSRSLTRLRRDCRRSLPILPAAAPLVLARLSRPPKPPATQANNNAERQSGKYTINFNKSSESILPAISSLRCSVEALWILNFY